MFKHHPDDYIVFADGFLLSLEEFLMEEPDYPGLPESMAGREYMPGVKHFLFDAEGNAYPQPLDWNEGDQYIAQRDTYLANQQARIAAAQAEAEAAEPPPLEPLMDQSSFEALAIEEKVDYLYQRLALQAGS